MTRIIVSQFGFADVFLHRLLSDWPRPLRPMDDPHVPCLKALLSAHEAETQTQTHATFCRALFSRVALLRALVTSDACRCLGACHRKEDGQEQCAGAIAHEYGDFVHVIAGCARF